MRKLRVPVVLVMVAGLSACVVYQQPGGGYTLGGPPGAGGSGMQVLVPADRSDPVFSPPLAAGAEYVVQASGVFSAWGDKVDGVDALYGYAEWRVGRTPEYWNQLIIDDKGMGDIMKAAGDPAAYQPSHVYACVIRGTGGPAKLQIRDAIGSSGDNHGGLNVLIRPR